MHFLAVSLRKDWARVRRDPFSLLTALAIPVVLAVLLTAVFGRDPAMPHGLLLVADEDHSVASASILAPFHSDQLARMLTIETVGRDTGRKRVDDGDASALLVIPAGFQQAFRASQPFQLQLVTNPSERILPAVIQEALAVALDAAFYFRRWAGAPRNPLETGLITVDTSIAQTRRRSVNFAAVFLPSMLFMGMLFIASSLAADIWRERTSGTLRRLASSPVPLSGYLGSRMVFVVIVYCLVAFVGLQAAHGLSAMPVANLAAATAWMAFSGVVFYLMFLWVAMSASTQRGAGVLANLVIFPLAMLGGSFFPFEWMPRWMAAIGRFTPNGWAIIQFQAILNGAASERAMLISVAALGGFGGLAFAFALRRLRSGFAV